MSYNECQTVGCLRFNYGNKYCSLHDPMYFSINDIYCPKCSSKLINYKCSNDNCNYGKLWYERNQSIEEELRRQNMTLSKENKQLKEQIKTMNANTKTMSEENRQLKEQIKTFNTLSEENRQLKEQIETMNANTKTMCELCHNYFEQEFDVIDVNEVREEQWSSDVNV